MTPRQKKSVPRTGRSLNLHYDDRLATIATTTAATTATEIATTTTTAAAAEIATRTIFTGTSFVDGQRPAIELLAVEFGNRAIGLILRRHLDETETA
ncbi:MAG: hypothetical protein A2X46_18400 [Lentisphaerae bacterium GWF2_57_35]|nr:MAG: hypothetical protein A2X46_18400 [Lentisphaerae bacterium GWF2_57_35]